MHKNKASTYVEASEIVLMKLGLRGERPPHVMLSATDVAADITIELRTITALFLAAGIALLARTMVSEWKDNTWIVVVAEINGGHAGFLETFRSQATQAQEFHDDLEGRLGTYSLEHFVSAVLVEDCAGMV